MQRSTDRILTTHAGSLPRPGDLLELIQAKATGRPYDQEAFASRVKRAVGEIVRRFLLLALQLLRALPDVVQLPLRRALRSGVASRRPGEGRPDGKCDRCQAQQQDEDFPETHVRRVASRRKAARKWKGCAQCQIKLRRMPRPDQIQQGV